MEEPEVMVSEAQDAISQLAIEAASTPAAPDVRQAEEAANGPEAVDPTGADGDGEEDPGSTSDEGDDEEEYDSALEDDAVVVDDEENSSSETVYSEEEIQSFIDQLVEKEGEAAEAQEALEDESMDRTRDAVFEELSDRLSGPELEAEMTAEMTNLIDQWEEQLASLEEDIALLHEKLDDASINLPELYKRIEKQAPENCTTEAWKKRTHWAGLIPTPEATEVVKIAEKELTVQRPVRRHHGRIQDEGASGFLVKQVMATTNVDVGTSTEDSWALVGFLDRDEENPEPGLLRETKEWVDVYLASTPVQAAQMGLSLPGVDTVEEIGDLDTDKSKLFKEALANEKEFGLTEQQKTSVIKVREEDDVKKSRKLQRKTLPRRPRKPRAPYVRRKTDAHRLKNELEVSSSGPPCGDPTLSVYLTIEEDSTPAEIVCAKLERRLESLEQDLDTKCQVAGLKADSRDEDLHANKDANQTNGPGTSKVQKESSGPWLVDSVGVVYIDGRGLFGEKLDPDLEEGAAAVMQSKRRLTPIEIEAESSDSKRLKTTVVIDSDGEREEVGLQRGELGRKQLGATGRRSSRNLAELVVVGSRKDSSEQIYLEKSKSGQFNSPSPQGEDQSEEDLRLVRKKRAGSMRFYQDNGPRDFPCTACGMLLKNREVVRHPQLDVGICKKCKDFLFSGPFHKDKDGSEDECRWCGQGGDVLCCDTCDKVFCNSCIKRNFTQEALDKIVNSESWHCFFCNKAPLNDLIQKYQVVKEATKLQITLDSDDDDSSDKEDMKKEKKRRGRRNIRRVLDDKELDEKTQNLLALEKERQERLESWRAKSRANGNVTPVKPNRQNRGPRVDEDELEMDDRDRPEDGFILNKARQEDEEPILVSPHISGLLRPHQLAGLRFMWENCIESVSKVKSGVDGLGCILAHSMGLGKTLQVIAFIDTVLKRPDLGLRTVLIVVPVNVLHNWRSEFNKWQPPNEKPIAVYMLEDVARDNFKRAGLLNRWKNVGGVMLIGYTAFRNLSVGKTVKEKSVREELCDSLQNPGPDILVCDEAHMIKNRKADITQALRQVRTHRRIALTGSPLQNNLMEYYCMVDFVREGFLGPAPSFKRRFQNPIENGQRADSTLKDVKIMKNRAHVLHKQLKGFVQRKTMSVLKDELPSKCVYVISVRLSPLQRSLYMRFLQVHGLLESGAMAKQHRGTFLFEAYHTLAKIWNHPDLLLLAQEEKTLRKEDNLENFIVDTDDDVPEVPNGVLDVIPIDLDTGLDETLKVCAEGKPRLSNGTRTLSKLNSDMEDVNKSGWWKDMMDGRPREVADMSGKMVILLQILSMSSAKGDKALVFSQSLHTLDLIEIFLENTPCLHGFKGNWKKNRDWYSYLDPGDNPSLFDRSSKFLLNFLKVKPASFLQALKAESGLQDPFSNPLDGQTSAKSRQELVERFNDPDNTSVQCVLISTRAGSLGINLPAANRVIIFDGSWNPTHDLQALFRAWRFGQKKAVYAYRLLASGTMEEKIYNRQVAKEGLAARVLDAHQVQRYFVEDDLEFLFKLDKDDDDNHQIKASEGNASKKPEVPPSIDPDTPSTSMAPAQMEYSALPQGGCVQAPGKIKRMAFSIPNDAPPRDDVMGRLLLEYRPKWVVRYHEHEPLLEDLEDEKLTKEEQTLAWESFQQEGAEWSGAPTPAALQMAQTPAPQFPGPLPTIVSQIPSMPAVSLVAAQAPSPAHPITSQSTPSQSGASPCKPAFHVGQLREKGIRAGHSTPCKVCGMDITWETITRY